MNTFKVGDKITVNATGVRRHVQCTRDCTQGKVYELTRIATLCDGSAEPEAVGFIDDAGDGVSVDYRDVALAKQ